MGEKILGCLPRASEKLLPLRRSDITSPSTTFKAWLDENRAETEAQMHRIEAMTAAALSRDDAENLKAKMEQSGFINVTLAAETAPGSGAQIGWLVEAERA